MTYNFRVARILDELESQGLTIGFHMELKNTWFINSDADFIGYLATSDELIELEQSRHLNLCGVRSLGTRSPRKRKTELERLQ